MIVLSEHFNGTDRFVVSARSDDGRVDVLENFHSEPELIDLQSGRRMWRGVYQDADGFFRNDTVPADIWATACATMSAMDKHNAAISDAAEKRAAARLAARADAIPDIMLQWDRPDSDL